MYLKKFKSRVIFFGLAYGIGLLSIPVISSAQVYNLMGSQKRQPSEPRIYVQNRTYYPEQAECGNEHDTLITVNNRTYAPSNCEENRSPIVIHAQEITTRSQAALQSGGCVQAMDGSGWLRIEASRKCAAILQLQRRADVGAYEIATEGVRGAQ